MILITEGSLESLVNLIVLAVEKSHTVSDDGVVTVMAKADERRLRVVIANEYHILIEWKYQVTGAEVHYRGCPTIYQEKE